MSIDTGDRSTGAGKSMPRTTDLLSGRASAANPPAGSTIDSTTKPTCRTSGARVQVEKKTARSLFSTRRRLESNEPTDRPPRKTAAIDDRSAV